MNRTSNICLPFQQCESIFETCSESTHTEKYGNMFGYCKEVNLFDQWWLLLATCVGKYYTTILLVLYYILYYWQLSKLLSFFNRDLITKGALLLTLAWNYCINPTVVAMVITIMTRRCTWPDYIPGLQTDKQRASRRITSQSDDWTLIQLIRLILALLCKHIKLTDSHIIDLTSWLYWYDSFPQFWWR